MGVVVADVATDYSHWTAVESLSEWCAREGVVRYIPNYSVPYSVMKYLKFLRMERKSLTDLGTSLPSLELILEQS